MEYFREIYRVFLIGEGRPLVLIFGGALLLVLLVMAVERLRIALSPLRTVTATVVEVDEHVSRTANIGSGPHRRHASSVTYFITFLLTGGEKVKLMVPSISAVCIQEGDQGKLTYRGHKYIAFEQYDRIHTAD